MKILWKTAEKCSKRKISGNTGKLRVEFYNPGATGPNKHVLGVRHVRYNPKEKNQQLEQLTEITVTLRINSRLTEISTYKTNLTLTGYKMGTDKHQPTTVQSILTINGMRVWSSQRSSME